MMRLWASLFLAAFVMAVVIQFDLHSHLTLDTLRTYRTELRQFVTDRPAAAMLAFVGLYAAIAAASLPGAAVMTVGAGLLFGTLIGAAVAVAGATTGATLAFLFARSTFGNVLRRRAGPYLQRLEAGFHSNAFSYLMFMRLIPAFPFWAVNLAAGLLHVPLITFVSSTALGIIPGTFIYAAFGAGLDAVFAEGTTVTLAEVFTPDMLAALVGLGFLALAPIALDRWRRR